MAVPQNAGLKLKSVIDGMVGFPSETCNGEDITEQFYPDEPVAMPLKEGGEMYDVWCYTYATRPKYKNLITVELENNG